MVIVYDVQGVLAEPCTNKLARLLLKNNKATIKSYRPFTIQLKFKIDSAYIEELNGDEK